MYSIPSSATLLLRIFMLLLLSLVLTACGGGGGDGGGDSVSLTNITISPDSATLWKGGTQQFRATATYSDGNTQDVTGSVNWGSSDTGVATIDASGLATGVDAGSATITASLSGVTSNSATLTVNLPVLQSISVAPATTPIVEGARQQFTATGSYSDGSTPDITASVSWTSSDTGVATIDASGEGTGVAPGTTTITASLSGVTSNSATLTVVALTGITITPVDPTIGLGATLQFTARGSSDGSTTGDITGSVTWASSDTNVATIDTSGLATGLAVDLGGVTITASITASQGTLSDTTTLYVDKRLVADVPFSDANLQACAEAAGTYVEDITTLDCQNRAITDLTGLEEFTSLTSLFLNNDVTQSVSDPCPTCNRISDLTPLAPLVNLNILRLEGNTTISDVSPLASLTALSQLLLGYNQIVDVSPLASLTNLTMLLLPDNLITDAEPLFIPTFIHLTDLDLYKNQIGPTTDLSLVINLVNLENLNIGDNNISVSDISALPVLSTLKILDVSDNNITDPSYLATFTLLEKLNIGGNGISDISSLNTLTNLIEFSIYKNNISNVSTISNVSYPNLETLVAYENNISTISAADIGSLSASLHNLYVGYNQISNISALTTLINLQLLHMPENLVSDFSPLASLGVLVDLDLTGMGVTDADINTFSGLPLTKLILTNNEITNVTDIGVNLTGLLELRLNDNLITTGVTDLTNLIAPTSINLLGNNSIPCGDLDTLDASFPGVVIRPASCVP